MVLRPRAATPPSRIGTGRLEWATAVGVWGDVFCACGHALALTRQQDVSQVGMLYWGPYPEAADWLRLQPWVREVRHGDESNASAAGRLCGTPRQRDRELTRELDGTGIDPATVYPTHIDAGNYRGGTPERWEGARLDPAARQWARETLDALPPGRRYVLQPYSLSTTRQEGHWPHWREAVEWLLAETPHQYLAVGLADPLGLADRRPPQFTSLIGRTTMQQALALVEQADGLITTANSLALWSQVQGVPSVVCLHEHMPGDGVNYYERWTCGEPNRVVPYRAGLSRFIEEFGALEKLPALSEAPQAVAPAVPIFIPYLNHPELLRDALWGLGARAKDAVVCDNSRTGLSAAEVSPARLVRPEPSLSMSASMNYAGRLAEAAGSPYWCFLHTDAVAVSPAVVERLLARAAAEPPGWGVMFTRYDVLAAFETEAGRAHRWDERLPWYLSDNDYYRRLRAAGCRMPEVGGRGVLHQAGSASKRGDPEVAQDLARQQPEWRRYYREKWGGDPGEEQEAPAAVEPWQTAPGWFDFQVLYRLFAGEARDGGRIVELGCFLGRSTLFLLALLRARNAGKPPEEWARLTVVDLFRAGPEHPGYGEVAAWGGQFLPEFLRRVEEAGFTDLVDVVQARTGEAHRLFTDGTLEAVFVDADHEYEAVRADLDGWAPKVRPGGLVAGHDYTKEFSGVVRAVQERFGGRADLSACPGSWLVRC